MRNKEPNQTTTESILSREPFAEAFLALRPKIGQVAGREGDGSGLQDHHVQDEHDEGLEGGRYRSRRRSMLIAQSLAK